MTDLWRKSGHSKIELCKRFEYFNDDHICHGSRTGTCPPAYGCWAWMPSMNMMTDDMNMMKEIEDYIVKKREYMNSRTY
jgi:hypothetical protein